MGLSRASIKASRSVSQSSSETDSVGGREDAESEEVLCVASACFDDLETESDESRVLSSSSRLETVLSRDCADFLLICPIAFRTVAVNARSSCLRLADGPPILSLSARIDLAFWRMLLRSTLDDLRFKSRSSAS